MRRLVPYILVFLAGLLVGSCRGASPSSELMAAVADLRSVPQERWRTTRYLSLYNVPENERDTYRAVLSYTLNAVSRAGVIKTPEANGTLVRFDIDSYGIPSAAWEAIVSRDPYWHQRTTVIDPRTNAKTLVYQDSGHTGLATATELRNMTGSGGSLVRGDWFLATALQAPAYYALSATPKTEKEWLAAGGTNDKDVIDLRANKGSSIFRSGVTHKPRRISRRQTITGGSWITRDSEEGKPENHPIRVPGFSVKFDASEAIAAKPNGLLAYALFNAKGELQNEVPPQIAKDDRAHDGRLVAPVSCIRCHDSTGFKPFANDFAAMLKGGTELHLPAEELDQLTAFYADTERLAKLLLRDQEDFDAAVSKATGGKYTADELPKVVGRMFNDYVVEQIDEERAKQDLGVVSLAGFRASNDPILLAIISKVRVNRADWELSFPEAALLTAGERR